MLFLCPRRCWGCEGCLEAETSGFCLTLSVAFGSFIQAAGGRRDPPRPVSRTDSDGGGERSAVLGGLSAWGERLPGPHCALFGAGVELPLGSLDFSEPGLQRCLLSVVFGLLFFPPQPPLFFIVSASVCSALISGSERDGAVLLRPWHCWERGATRRAAKTRCSPTAAAAEPLFIPNQRGCGSVGSLGVSRQALSPWDLGRVAAELSLFLRDQHGAALGGQGRPLGGLSPQKGFVGASAPASSSGSEQQDGTGCFHLPYVQDLIPIVVGELVCLECCLLRIACFFPEGQSSRVMELLFR